ncbi:hypothetical protein GLI01_10840 [Gluconacetobacter liquefaciens]|uniref:DUF3108 domain-containing protein n=1 Tax=Gluconacetobacter liquefaciens TaxID=89584 RepID=A0A370G9H1_GLULI|nr:hypothetical protein [Gluconacetobacter liquefaciens]RDI38633.1 hypothetical protein C7453_10393 [Gluconacetobacter liquefaciens]GBR09023.1 hypothetical protein AA0522_2293 [Gluconacetobacter liquefaciens NRIC 0522]GEB37049.1 hypothetical protein GLI01_10840 [Gluconacetobacter liquefaciens]
MKRLFLTAACLVLTAAAPPPMQGERLEAGATYFILKINGHENGRLWRVLRKTELNGRRVWDIVLHLKGVGCEAREHYVVDRTSLLPIMMDSTRGRDRRDRNWERIRLRYDARRIWGTRESSAGSKTISVALNGPTWEGHLLGVTLAALPLAEGGRYTLPTWHYDGGEKQITAEVVGDIVAPYDGRPAWVVEAGDGSSDRVRYEIARSPRAEMGYRVDLHAPGCVKIWETSEPVLHVSQLEARR